MNDREILDKLWEACRETPFASFSLQRKLDLRPQEDTATRKLTWRYGRQRRSQTRLSNQARSVHSVQD